MKTAIFVDGYNTYYGLLKHTNFKWLDLPKFFRQILHSIDPASEVVNIKFFTAPVITKASSPDAQACQQTYWHALEAHSAGLVEIICGKYQMETGKVRACVEGLAYLSSPELRAWQLEEKRTDVSIALHAYQAALQGQAQGDIQQVVLCTNDSDQVPTLQFIREVCPDIRVGLIIPRRSAARPASTDLVSLAHWHRGSINDDELASAQLPRIVETITGMKKVKGVLKPRRKIYRRPDAW